ncbi:hypothetical protein [Virgibacillus ihumii]|uniref:hypothetical protein n=1 Tax=Virgibacillus ihumii TaxID=2686091 RepID=UPI00157DD07C|nr:hypothetical protein [Virgibacillus ihumii]
MKQTIRSFALGLLVAGIIILASFYFTADTRQASQKLSTDEMITSIENEGYHVLSESEYISVSVKSDNSENNSEETENEKNKQDTSTDKNKENQQKKENKNEDDNSDSNNESKDSTENDSDKKETVTYTLTVESGMAPSVISNKLAENNIIDNADKFTQYMENHDYTQMVQLGEFKFTSDMSHYEIAEKLTN